VSPPLVFAGVFTEKPNPRKGLIEIKLLVAAKGVIIKGGRALILIRSEAEMENGEFDYIEEIDLPGGIIQAHEKVEDGLIREIKEETNLDVEVLMPFKVSDNFGPGLHIVGVLYLCRYLGGEVALGTEHRDYKWVSRKELNRESASWAYERIELAFDMFEKHFQ